MKLSKKQKEFIDKNYLQIPDIDQLTRALFEDESLDDDGNNDYDTDGGEFEEYDYGSDDEWKSNVSHFNI